MQNVEHQEVMSQQHNQTIMITGNQSQQQQPPQTPPIQQVMTFFGSKRTIDFIEIFIDCLSFLLSRLKE